MRYTSTFVTLLVVMFAGEAISAPVLTADPIISVPLQSLSPLPGGGPLQPVPPRHKHHNHKAVQQQSTPHSRDTVGSESDLPTATVPEGFRMGPGIKIGPELPPSGSFPPGFGMGSPWLGVLPVVRPTPQKRAPTSSDSGSDSATASPDLHMGPGIKLNQPPSISLPLDFKMGPGLKLGPGPVEINVPPSPGFGSLPLEPPTPQRRAPLSPDSESDLPLALLSLLVKHARRGI